MKRMKNGGRLTLADNSGSPVPLPVPPGEVVRSGGSPHQQIRLPDGDCWISRPIVLRKNGVLVGAGERHTTIRTTADFVGTEMVRLEDSMASDITIEALGFQSSVPGVAAIRQAATAVLNPVIRRLYLDVPFGIILDGYTQAASISGVKSVGPIEQLLCLAGNANRICDVDHEGACGTSADPFVLIKGFTGGYSKGNHLRNVIIEGTGCALKTPFVLDHVEDIVLENTWGEVAAGTGYQLDIADCIGVVRLRQNYIKLEKTRKVRIQRTNEVHMEVANLNSATMGVEDVFEVDDVSHLTIERLHTRDGRGAHAPRKNVSVKTGFNQTVRTQAVPGYWPASTVLDIGANRLANPSFSGSSDGWTIEDSPTVTLEGSPFDAGTAARFTWQTAADHGITQAIAISAAQVGYPMTFAARVSAISGNSSNGCAAVYVEGCGLPYRNYSQARIGTGWQIIAQTITPLEAGTLTVGVSAYYLTGLIVDSCSLRAGTTAIPDIGGP